MNNRSYLCNEFLGCFFFLKTLTLSSNQYTRQNNTYIFVSPDIVSDITLQSIMTSFFEYLAMHTSSISDSYPSSKRARCSLNGFVWLCIYPSVLNCIYNKTESSKPNNKLFNSHQTKRQLKHFTVEAFQTPIQQYRLAKPPLSHWVYHWTDKPSDCSSFFNVYRTQKGDPFLGN